MPTSSFQAKLTAKNLKRASFGLAAPLDRLTVGRHDPVGPVDRAKRGRAGALHYPLPCFPMEQVDRPRRDAFRPMPARWRKLARNGTGNERPCKDTGYDPANPEP